MSTFLISGLINIETTLKIEKFPLDYYPVTFPFHGINSNVSGVAINIGNALTRLGDTIEVMSIIGDDIEGRNVKEVLEKNNLSTDNIITLLDKTPQSVILFDKNGKRQIHCDLKNIQDVEYPEDKFMIALEKCDVAILCTINFSRKYLKKAKELNKLIATDLHVIFDINDSYNKEFLEYADIIFFSDEGIKRNLEEFVLDIVNKYNTKIIIVGLGSEGALLYYKEDNFIGRFSAVKTREVVNTIGAGDSLFSSFLHYYVKEKNPYEALKRAIIFASYKIGETIASSGFLNENEIERWYKKIYIK